MKLEVGQRVTRPSVIMDGNISAIVEENNEDVDTKIYVQWFCVYGKKKYITTTRHSREEFILDFVKKEWIISK